MCNQFLAFSPFSSPVTQRENSTFPSKMARALKTFIPLFDRVLVQKLAAETTTKGGIMLPEKAVGKVLDATVVAVGPGSRNAKGELVACSVKAGDQVLLPEFGGTKLKFDDKEYHLFRDGDILGKFTES